jgi:integrase/recombinase XerC
MALELLPVESTATVAVPLPSAGDLYGEWLAGRKATTVAAYAGDVAAFAKWAGAAGPAQAVEGLLAAGPAGANRIAHAWRAAMVEAELAPATINRRLSALRSLVELAGRLGVVTWSLKVEGVKARPYRDTRGPGVPAVRAMVEHLDQIGTVKAIRDRALVRLMFDRGLRRGEVVALDLDDVDTARHAVRVIGKGHTEGEWLTIGHKASEALAAYVAVRGEEPGPLFRNLDRSGPGGRLTGRSVARIVAELGEEAGVGTVRPHGLRHSAITHVLDMTNGNVRQAREFSRHADVRVLVRYDDARTDVGGDLAHRLGEAL